MLFRVWYNARRRYRYLMVSKDKELVIEGYPRCANSFAVAAFESVQRRPVAIAHHLHAEGQIIFGVKYRIPVLVLIRDPIGAVTSLVTRHPEVGVGQALKRYLRFYSVVERFSSHIVVADFLKITTDYASVIQRLNKSFGLEYSLYHNNPRSDAGIFADLDRYNLMDSQGSERAVARPTETKSRLLAKRREKVSAHHLLSDADKLYARITGIRGALDANVFDNQQGDCARF